MGQEIKLEQEVRDIIKRNRWLILSTTSPKGRPQSSLVMYASDGHKIIILTGKNTQKIKNITRNPAASITIPFYKNFIHRMITLAPPASIVLKANAEIIDFGDEAVSGFYQRVLNFKLPEVVEEGSVWLRLEIGGTATCHGVGVRLFDLRDPEKAHKIIRLNNR
jgi:nitroimidazol reductase NimA-like FMN-containing flavoprotein (pyridoxamine 5'-phosphate oxidase superfamily)